MITTTHHKPADNLHPIHDLIRHRWSPRAFSSRPVEQEKLDSLFEAARWAASANNMQPWHFVYATNEQPEEHARLTSILFERNAMWAQKAPVLVLVVAKLYETPGRETVSFYDVGMASGALVTQAVDLGLATHQMGGFDASKAREELSIPEGYAPLAMIAIGYPGHADDLAADFRERELAPRVRKEQKDFVFQGRWNG